MPGDRISIADVRVIHLQAGTMHRDAEQASGSFGMYAVVRIYTGPGAKQFFDILEERKEDLEAAHQHVKGLMSYTLVRSEDGGVAVTVCREKSGAH